MKRIVDAAAPLGRGDGGKSRFLRPGLTAKQRQQKEQSNDNRRFLRQAQDRLFDSGCSSAQDDNLNLGSGLLKEAHFLEVG